MKSFLLILTLLLASAHAEPMRFESVRNGGNCDGCAYTQATGEIISNTVRDFERYLASEKFPGPVRLHSPGGNLGGGIELGEAIRVHGMSDHRGVDHRQRGTRRTALAHWSTIIPHRRCAVGLLVQKQHHGLALVGVDGETAARHGRVLVLRRIWI
jgi:hypothetical protein